MTERTEIPGACELGLLQSLMGEVVHKSSAREGTCVYRGEPESYTVVSSGLYRKCLDSANEAFDITRAEQEMVENARQYTTLVDDDEILAEIQHFGGATNLIDFTDDYLIALFFASVGSEGQDGRVVLHWPEPNTVVKPKQTINRVVFQKSVFVRPRRGFIVPNPQDETIVVPGDLKEGILSFLERFHGISERTVFNDIHGFIKHQNPDRSRYAGQFRESLARPRRNTGPDLTFCLEEGLIATSLESMRHAYHQKGMVYMDDEMSTISFRQILTAPDQRISYSFWFEPEQFVVLFNRLVESNQGFLRLEECYCRRGEAHLYLGATDLAMCDFEEALARTPEMAEAYHGRGNAYRQQGRTDQAMADLEEALRLKPDLPNALIDRGNAYLQSGSLDKATQDFDTAISIMRMGAFRRLAGPGDGHFFRAVARCVQDDWVGAKADLESARKEGVLFASSFRNICGGVAKFEAEHGLRVPSDVATMLHVG